MSGGREIGRAQARLTPGPGADLATRLAHAPVFAQVRYAGAADILWRMTGVDAIDISGPVSVAADVTGRVDDPQIKGSLRTTNARLESPLTGTVLTQVQASGRFGGGSKLVLDSLTARSGAEGSVTARGEIDLSSARGFAMDIQIDAKQARLIERDEIAATVTGPLRLKSENGQGLISGDLLLDKSRYVLGKSTAVSALPKLNVREINAPEDRPTALAVAMPWRLAVAARAPGRLSVTGMGMESEWKATLDIQGTPYAPSIRGRADMLRGGYDFAGRRFDLKRGSIRFQGETPADPILDILAEGATQGLTASIRVTGTGQKPEIRFSSVPSLPEDELLSRMLFGTSIANLSAPEALQLASAVASLRTGGDGISPLNALRKAIGLDRLRILPADSVTGQRTSVSAGKYLSRRAYVEVVTDGQGYSATRAEFQVTRWLAILSTISSVGRQSAALRVTKDY
jgi:translocation and assembly module TamB